MIVIMSEAMDKQLCKSCKLELSVDLFESFNTKSGVGYCKECKDCKAAKRKEKAKDAPKKYPSKFELPKACVQCGKGPEEVKFQFRTDVMAGGYRNICNRCFTAKGYYTAYRKRKRAQDEDAFLANNNAVHREWL